MLKIMIWAIKEGRKVNDIQETVSLSVFIPISLLIEKFSKCIAVNGIQMEFNNKVLFY